VARECRRRILEDPLVFATAVDPSTELLDESVEGREVANWSKREMAAHDGAVTENEPTPGDDARER